MPEYTLTEAEFNLLQGLLPWVNFVLISLFLLWIAHYALKSFGLYFVAKKLKYNKPWLGFIPIFSTYLQGQLAREVCVGDKIIKSPGLWLILFPLITNFATVILYGYFFLPLFTENSNNLEGLTYFVGNLCYFVMIYLIRALFGAVKIAYNGLILYVLYKKFTQRTKAVIHMLLSLFLPFYRVIYILSLRHIDLT